MMKVGQTLGGNGSRLYGLADGAVRLMGVIAVGEAALADMRLEFAKSLMQPISVDGPESEAAYSGRVDQRSIPR